MNDLEEKIEKIRDKINDFYISGGSFIWSVNDRDYQFGVRKKVTYVCYKKRNYGFDEEMNLICLDFNDNYYKEVQVIIKELDEIVNIHPNIKNHFNIPLKKSEVYL